jgi:hypothetical protein
MALRTLTKFRNPDITTDINHRLRRLVRKGVFFGGQVVPVAGSLTVSIQPFAAMGNDGMVTLLEATPELVTVNAGADQYVLLHAEYRANQDPIVEFEVLTIAAYTALSQSNKDVRVILARVTLSLGATEATVANITFLDSDKVDPVDRSFIRGIVTTKTALPDYTSPPTGATTQNRNLDSWLVEDEKVFYTWNASALPAQWQPLISSASELDLTQHRLNQDVGSPYEAQHVDVVHRDALDAGSASEVKYAADGTAFGSANPFVDGAYPFAVRERVLVSGLGGDTFFQLLGTYYVGNGALGTAKNYFELSRPTTSMKLLGSDREKITVGAVFRSDNIAQVDPSVDADALGFITDPYIYMNFGFTVDSNYTGDLVVHALVRRSYGDVDATTFGKIPSDLNVPAEDIPVIGAGFIALSTSVDDVQEALNGIDAVMPLPLTGQTVLPYGLTVSDFGIGLRGGLNGHLFFDLRNNDGNDGFVFRYDSTDSGGPVDSVAMAIQGNSGAARVSINGYPTTATPAQLMVSGSARFARTGFEVGQAIEFSHNSLRNWMISRSLETSKVPLNFYALYTAGGVASGSVGFNWYVGEDVSTDLVMQIDEDGLGMSRTATSGIAPTTPYIWSFGSGDATNYDVRIASVTPGLVLQDATGGSDDFRFGVDAGVLVLSIDTDDDDVRDVNQHFDDARVFYATPTSLVSYVGYGLYDTPSAQALTVAVWPWRDSVGAAVSVAVSSNQAAFIGAGEGANALIDTAAPTNNRIPSAENVSIAADTGVFVYTGMQSRVPAIGGAEHNFSIAADGQIVSTNYSRLGANAGNSVVLTQLRGYADPTSALDLNYLRLYQYRHTTVVTDTWLNSNMRLIRYVNSTPASWIDFGLNNTTADNFIGFGTNGQTRWYIDSSGNLVNGAVGTTGAVAIFDIQTNDGVTDDQRLMSWRESASQSFFLAGDFAGAGATNGLRFGSDLSEVNIFSMQAGGNVGFGVLAGSAQRFHVTSTQSNPAWTALVRLEGASGINHYGDDDLVVENFAPGIRFIDKTGTAGFRIGVQNNELHVSIDTDADDVRNVTVGGDYDDITDALVMTLGGNIGLSSIASASFRVTVDAAGLSNGVNVSTDGLGHYRMTRTSSTTRTWDIGISSTGSFFVRDINTGALPFSIDPATPGDVLVVDNNSRVGINVAAPGHVLHVLDGSGTFYYDGSAATSGYNAFITQDDTGVVLGHNSAARDLRLATNSTPHLRVNQVGLIAIGLDASFNPIGNVHIRTIATGGGVTAAADELIIESTSSVGMTFMSSASSLATIAFGDPADGDAGKITYLHSSDTMTFTAANDRTFAISNEGSLLLYDQPNPDVLTPVADELWARNGRLRHYDGTGTLRIISRAFARTTALTFSTVTAEQASTVYTIPANTLEDASVVTIRATGTFVRGTATGLFVGARVALAPGGSFFATVGANGDFALEVTYTWRNATTGAVQWGGIGTFSNGTADADDNGGTSATYGKTNALAVILFTQATGGTATSVTFNQVVVDIT